jgi:hypothetical protein
VTRVSLPQIWWMCSSDESRHRPCHPKLVVATSGESIQPAACCHETPIFEPP